VESFRKYFCELYDNEIVLMTVVILNQAADFAVVLARTGKVFSQQGNYPVRNAFVEEQR